MIAALKESIARITLNDDGLAYKKLFLCYHPRLLSFSYANTHYKEPSEEVVSGVFLKIRKIRRRLLTIDNSHLYIYASRKNISLKYLATEPRVREFSLDNTKTELKNLFFDPAQLPTTAGVFDQRAFQGLPPRFKMFFRLIKEGNRGLQEGSRTFTN